MISTQKYYLVALSSYPGPSTLCCCIISKGELDLADGRCPLPLIYNNFFFFFRSQVWLLLHRYLKELLAFKAVGKLKVNRKKQAVYIYCANEFAQPSFFKRERGLKEREREKKGKRPKAWS
jgi:hypothetical protein